MDADDLHPRATPADPLLALRQQDLDHLSQAELDARVAALEAEIARTRARLGAAASMRSAADALFAPRR